MADTCREEADAQPFLIEFFNVFGISSRKVSTFELFINETKRIEFLFELYDKYTAGLFAVEGKKRKKNA